MPRPPFSMAFLGAVLAGCTVAPPAAILPAASPSAAASRPAGLLWTADGGLWVVRSDSGGCRAEQWDPSGSRREAHDLPFCPSTAQQTDEGLILRSGPTSLRVREGGIEVLNGAVLDVAGEARLELADGGVTFRPSGHTQPVGGEVRGARLLSAEAAVILVRDPEGDSLIRVRTSGEPIPIAGPFAEIDSFDVSPDGRDVVFSARRDDGFDVGLAASEGGNVAWIPPDPLDERMVSWAPRGNKVTFRIETPVASVLRSVHIPTGFQLSVPMSGHARELAWEPRAERFAVRLESAAEADRVEVLRYGGEERRTVVPPAARFGIEGQALEGVPGAVVFPPENLRYDETVPVAIWVDSGSPAGWHPARLRLHQNRRSGTIVVPAGATAGSPMWDAVASLPWIDDEAIFVVAAEADPIVRSIPAGIRPTVLTSGETAAAGAAVTRLPGGNLEQAAVEWLERTLERRAGAAAD